MAAIEHTTINCRYARSPEIASRADMCPIANAKTAIDATVPTPNAIRYAAACPAVGNASTGNTPRKCELPANPWSIPIPKAAC